MRKKFSDVTFNSFMDGGRLPPPDCHHGGRRGLRPPLTDSLLSLPPRWSAQTLALSSLLTPHLGSHTYPTFPLPFSRTSLCFLKRGCGRKLGNILAGRWGTSWQRGCPRGYPQHCDLRAACRGSEHANSHKGISYSCKIKWPQVAPGKV